MGNKKLRQLLEKILLLEENPNTDWNEVEQLCVSAIGVILSDQMAEIVPEAVYHFLDDFDIRSKSNEERYSFSQRQKVRAYLGAENAHTVNFPTKNGHC
jgi:hypothetical protein